MTVTAKIICDSISTQIDNDGNVVEARVHFQPDYADGRNKEWAKATPNLDLYMTLNGTAAHLFEQGQRYTLRFDVSREEPDMSTDRPVEDNPFVNREAEAVQAEEAHRADLEQNVQRNEQFKDLRDEESNE